jgi:glycosyltransferase involved in cell wall biosynthesis
MRLLALTRYDRLGSSSRIRFYQYFPFLERQGMEIVCLPLLDDDYVRRLYRGDAIKVGPIASSYLRRLSSLVRSGAFNLLWIEKELFPWLPALAERFLSALRVPFIVDFDDAVFHRYDAHSSSLVRLILGHKIDAVMRAAKLVVAGNNYIASRARKAGAKRVEILPSVVDMKRFSYTASPGNATQSNDNPLRIGWVGSPVTTPYLSLIQKPLETVARQGNVQIVLIGIGSLDPLPGLPKEKIEWNEELEPKLLESLDIGVMPLPDNPFERGKCGYKLVQYMAAGLPVVASPVGANTQIVKHATTGFLASTAQEWVEALQRLRDHPEMRARFGLAGRRRAEQFYSLEITAPKLTDLLLSCAR